MISQKKLGSLSTNTFSSVFSSSLKTNKSQFCLIEKLFFSHFFPKKKKVYPSEVISNAQLQVATKTKMVDWALDKFKELNGETAEPPKELEEARKSVLSDLENLSKKTKPLVKLLKNKEIIQQLVSENQFKLDNLQSKFEVYKDETI